MQHEEAGIRTIDSIKFLNEEVPVYYDKYADEFSVVTTWSARNPESFYQGLVYYNESDGTMEYPEDAVIPNQTPSDREVIPNAIIVGQKELTPYSIAQILHYLLKEYDKRNPKLEL